MAAASVLFMYGANKGDLRLNDLVSANIRFALVTSTYSPVITATGDALWSAVSANEIASTSRSAPSLASLWGSPPPATRHPVNGHQRRVRSQVTAQISATVRFTKKV